MSAIAVQFDQAEHAYTVGGARLPSVTQVLGELSARAYRFVDKDTMQRTAWVGQCVHAVIEQDSHDNLDEEALDAQLLPFLTKWRQFRAQSGFKVIHSEQRVASLRYGYAGTLDLFGRLNDRWALIDNKRTAGVPRTAGPQTAAYEAALRECYPELGTEPIDRYALQLTDAKWQLVPFRDRNDLRVFLSALQLFTWSAAA